jgi:HSP20 family protein
MERQDPLSEYRAIQEWLERQHRQVVQGRVPSIGRWTPQLDVLEGENDYRIQLALPGVRPDDVQITVEQAVVTVSGELPQQVPESGTRYLHQERVGGHFTRSIALPGMVDADRTSAHYEHGIMTITLPKHAATRPRRIAVQTTGDTQPPAPQGSATPPKQ